MMTFVEMKKSLRQRQKEELSDLEFEVDLQKRKSQELDEMWADFKSHRRTPVWMTQRRLGFNAAYIRQRIEKYDERYVYIYIYIC